MGRNFRVLLKHAARKGTTQLVGTFAGAIKNGCSGEHPLQLSSLDFSCGDYAPLRCYFFFFVAFFAAFFFAAMVKSSLEI
jgi:hypothetical protein